MAAIDDVHQMTVDEYLRAVHDFGWESTELIRGVVYDVTPEYNRHAATVMAIFRKVDVAFIDDMVRNVGSVTIGAWSLFDPDVYVIDGEADLDPDRPVPGSAVKLVVEVSVTTLTRDLGPKLQAYAEAGIAEVWVIDPRPGAGWLLRHTEPQGDRYRTVQHIEVGEDARDLDVGAVRGR